MSQSKTFSLIEAVTSTIIGYALSVGLGHVIYPLFGHAFTIQQNMAIVAVFTLASVLRGYSVRRFFIWLARYMVIRGMELEIKRIEAEAPYETCMCGAPMDLSAFDHGHTPVSQADYYTKELRLRLKVLKEGKSLGR